MKKFLVPSLLIASALASHGAAIHTGLLNYWTMDGNANDTSGDFTEATGATVDNGSVNGSTGFATGLFGSAASLPGGGGNNITFADSAASSAAGAAGGVADDIDRTGSNMTLSLWFKADEWTTGWQGIASHGEGQDYRIARRASNSPIQFAGVVGTSDMLTSSTYGNAPAGDGLWHNIVIAGTNGGSAVLYVDGVLEATSVGLGDPTVSIGPSGTNNNVLCVGCNPDNGREFDGLIDDVALWDRELTATEIGLIYSSGQNSIALGAIPEPGIGLLASLAGLLMIFRRRR